MEAFVSALNNWMSSNNGAGYLTPVLLRYKMLFLKHNLIISSAF